MAYLWISIANDGDFVQASGLLEPEFIPQIAEYGFPRLIPLANNRTLRESVEICPWGWSPEISPLTKRGLNLNNPAFDVVREVNSRRFANHYERETNTFLADSTTISSLEEFQKFLKRRRNQNSPWILKTEFSMSARDRLMGRENQVSLPMQNWIRKRLQRDGLLFYEPWVERISEVGLQFEIPQSGDPVLMGVPTLFTDPFGRYRGSGFQYDESIVRNRWQEAISVAHRVCVAMQSRGYFGPVGFDAVRYRDSQGTERIRPLQDINARWTMGRLCLGFRRILQPGETGIWWHTRWPTESTNSPQKAYEQFQANLPEEIRAVRTSPFTVNHQPVGYGTILLIGKPGFPLTDWFARNLSGSRENSG
ncbi:MAG: hypothetical protein Tsb009_05860 [Planctomycetaceae bacterium]